MYRERKEEEKEMKTTIFKKENTMLFHEEFVLLVWREAQDRFETYADGVWCNLTFEEQIALYCEEYDRQIYECGWKMSSIEVNE